jgi:hypothetical protein
MYPDQVLVYGPCDLPYLLLFLSVFNDVWLSVLFETK